MSPRAAIVSLAGPTLSGAERDLLAALPPAGVILFARNCETPAQLRALTAAVREAAGDPALAVLIDQEGGRVARLRPPRWSALPAMAALGRLAAADRAAGLMAATLAAGAIAADLAAAGITVDCAPVLDLGLPGATPAIGDRAFAADPDLVAALGRALAAGLLAGGVAPVLKHVPGHGRAEVDSHVALPVVRAPLSLLRATDFRPFRALADLPLAMTAHVVYEAIDPDAPATLSARVIRDVIRGEIGFSGVLLTDDLGMGALSGSLAERARRALAAGCDLALYCGGRVEEAHAILAAVAPLPAATVARWRAAVPAPRSPRPHADRPLITAALDRLLART